MHRRVGGFHVARKERGVEEGMRRDVLVELPSDCREAFRLGGERKRETLVVSA